MTNLEHTLASLPHRYPGPGGAAAVLRHGQVLASHAWGYADIAGRLPFTQQTPFLICSITKQFTCALMLDQVGRPEALDAAVAARLPLLQQPAPTARELANNQSGLRDYWATAMLAGALPEQVFTNADAARLIARTRSLHFAPGTSYSYCNQNFRILAELVEDGADRPYAELLRTRIFDRAGMPHAALNADTAHIAGGTVGYEGSAEDGFRAAVNNIHWTGDAGIAASLDDLIAWEKHIDATRDDPASLYARLSAPVTFRNAMPAPYGLGLNHNPIAGRPATSHGGGLRGWRSLRFNLPAERLSVVVLFNHMADPRAAALDLLATQLDAPPSPSPSSPQPFAWSGRYLDPATGLATRIDATQAHRPRLTYDRGPELLTPATPDHARGPTTQLRAEPDGLWMDRPTENISTRLTPCPGTPTPDIAGTYHSEEYAADLTITAPGGPLYAAFSGPLGQGEMQRLDPYGPDLWLMPCPRSLDFGAPGDWTMQIRRNANKQITGVTLGCWLARNVDYVRK